jgi:hypothetical protein
MANLEESTFREVGKSDTKMYGHPALILAGAKELEQFAVRELMNVNGLGEIPVVVVTRETIDTTLNEVAQLPDGTGFGVEEELPRAIIMSGLTEAQFHTMMDSYRKIGLPRPLWASVTPTSEAWTIKALLIELLNENRQLREASRPKAEAENAENQD